MKKLDAHKYGLILFDVDGVILDSLQAHVFYFNTKVRELCPNIGLITRKQVKHTSRKNITPFYNFIKALGFPNEYIEDIIEDYKKNFSSFYSIKPSDEVRLILYTLSEYYSLGYLTSNYKANISKQILSIDHLFDLRFKFCLEDLIDGSKAKTIDNIISCSAFDAEDILYIGDQLSDWEAAKSNPGVDFIGITSGYGLDFNFEYPFITRIHLQDLFYNDFNFILE